jgi:hypothetical protein
VGLRITTWPRVRSARTPQPAPEAALGPGGLEALARVLSALLCKRTSADQVRQKALGLGLLRQPGPGEQPEFSARTASRHFLAGYQLPASVEVGTLANLRDHLDGGRQVYVLLVCDGPVRDGAGATDRVAWRLVDCPAVGAAESFVVLTEPTAPVGTARLLSRERFLEAWQAGGYCLIAAARGWGDLPAQGSTFFGGSRSEDGTYFWHTAACDTDGRGRVLCCY